MYNNSKKIIIISILSTLILLILLSPIPIKKKMEYLLANNKEFNTMVFYSSHLESSPNKEISFRLYKENGNLVHKADIKLNNLGMFPPKIEKTSNDTLKIVVLGGEQTASSTVNQSWPELLQKKFLDEGNVQIFNCAWPDAGPVHYLDIFDGRKNLITNFPKCGEFKPDLVIVNFIETDFYRVSETGAVELKYKGKKVGISNKNFSVNGFTGNFARVEGTEPTSLSNPNAIPIRPFAFLAPRELIDDSIKVSELQNFITKEFVEGFSPNIFQKILFVFLGIDLPHYSNFKSDQTLMTKVMNKINQLGNKYSNLGVLRNFDSIKSNSGLQSQETVQKAKPLFDKLFKLHENMLILESFNLSNYYSNCNLPLATKLKEYLDFESINMCKEFQKKDLNIKKVFLTDFMPEKFSEFGMGIYADIVYKKLQVILESN